MLIYHSFYNIEEPFGKKWKKKLKKAKKSTVKVVTNPKKAFNDLKKIIKKKIIQPIKVKINPPPPPPKPTRPYEYNFHSGIPKEYKEEY